MYMAEFKLRFGNRKWYVRRIVEAESYEEAVELAKKYAELMNKGEVKWELADVYEATRPLIIGEEEIKKLEG
ncbi:hypothetical protein PFDSM3638_10325 [Pyrococcus furiosus DSM 3638]|uniref:Uncharacterized protein n=2 Tax=Pyrococcus furiosus TaxID=2261 RepID=A0A5C0XTJ6_PYRFU|nr:MULTISPECIES: hypothetical protein [Pyrococcus]AFN04595.1 hypothetical protein PFC_08325 [Pyrococcus furiosus COM1]MDK2870009.1 hypothetical protein [Pyrococcus sp.]QEK79638.1 hypothetical protein PFDSM3638_10325 [Pyrococcus furiosus DSM 3638]